MFRYRIFYDIIGKQSGDWNAPTMIRRIWKEKRSPLSLQRGPFGYLKSGVVFGEIFQIHKKENSVAASPNNELMIFQ